MRNCVRRRKDIFTAFFHDFHRGMSVTEYVNYKKMERAKTLLRQGVSTNAIVEQLAFSDANYFSRVFRKFTGYTIRDYKKGSF